MSAAVTPRLDLLLFHIAFYDLALLVAGVLGLSLLIVRLRRLGAPLADAVCAAPLAVVAPVGLARLVDLALYTPERFLERPSLALEVLGGGLSSHGAVIGLVLATLLLSRLLLLPARPVADAVALFGLIGIAAARLGDHLGNDGYGTPTELPWAMPVRIAFDGGTLGRHPVNLYEMASVLGLAAFVLVLSRRWRMNRPGLAAALAATAYFAARLLFDGIRHVAEVPGLPRVAIGQAFSLPSMLASVALAITWRRAGPTFARSAERRWRGPVSLRLQRAIRGGGVPLSLALAGLLGAAVHAFVLSYDRRAGFAPTSPVVPLALLPLWATSFIGADRIARRVMGRLEALGPGPRRTILAAAWCLATAATLLAIHLTPMALGACIALACSVVLARGHSAEDLAVYFVAGSSGLGIAIAQHSLAPQGGEAFFPAVAALAGLAGVLASRVMDCSEKG